MTPSSHRELKRNPEQRDERREQRAQARSELRAEYDKQRAEFKPANTVSQARGQQKEKQKAVSAAHVAERKHIRQSGLPPEVQKAMLSEAALNAAKEREAIKMRADAESEAIKSDPANKPQSYRDWVGDRAEQGDPAALSQLRGFVYADKKKIKALKLAEAAHESQDGFAGAIKLKRVDPLLPLPRLLDQITTQADRRTGDVHYLLGRNRVFTDHGKHVVFNPVGAASDEAIYAGLLLAKEKFGNKLTINGSDEFKNRVIAVAIKNKIQVRFADQVLNSMHQEALDERMAERLRAAHPFRPEQVPVAAPVAQSTTELPVPGLASVLPKANRPYPGVILQEDAHYLYQDAGRGVVVRHLKSEVAAKTRVMPAPGEMFVMNYDANGKLLTAIPSKGGGRGGR